MWNVGLIKTGVTPSPKKEGKGKGMEERLFIRYSPYPRIPAQTDTCPTSLKVIQVKAVFAPPRVTQGEADLRCNITRTACWQVRSMNSLCTVLSKKVLSFFLFFILLVVWIFTLNFSISHLFYHLLSAPTSISFTLLLSFLFPHLLPLFLICIVVDWITMNY